MTFSEKRQAIDLLIECNKIINQIYPEDYKIYNIDSSLVDRLNKFLGNYECI